jgi:hypothetical protein
MPHFSRNDETLIVQRKNSRQCLGVRLKQGASTGAIRPERRPPTERRMSMKSH